MKQSHRVLKNDFQVALCMIFIICSCCCWTSSLSQSINGKHVAHTNKKSSTSQTDDEDISDDDYFNSNENEFGSSGSDLIIGTGSGGVGGELDEFQKNELPFFLKEPENEFIVKKRPAVLKCITTHAFEVRMFVVFVAERRWESCLSTLHPHIFKIMWS